MFEVAGLFLIMSIIAASAFFPLGCSIYFELTKKGTQTVNLIKKQANPMRVAAVPEDSVLRRHCLTHLQSEIESAFAPRPTDSVLQRHHDTLIASELEKRLEELQLTA